MAAYVIAEVETTDLELMRPYRDLAPPTVSAYGGRYIVRGGAVQTLEGDWEPARIAVLEFESPERARQWWESEEYREAKALRQRAGRTRMIIVDGV
jgi:uncharacterized protein (DUF1330 family)